MIIVQDGLGNVVDIGFEPSDTLTDVASVMNHMNVYSLISILNKMRQGNANWFKEQEVDE